MITIYHLNFEKAATSIETLELYKNITLMNEEDIIKALEFGIYKKVADVATKELEIAYTTMTNTEENWNTHPDVIKYSIDDRCSDVGDLALFNNKLYYITHLGFKPLPDNTIQLLPQEKFKLKI